MNDSYGIVVFRITCGYKNKSSPSLLDRYCEFAATSFFFPLTPNKKKQKHCTDCTRGHYVGSKQSHDFRINDVDLPTSWFGSMLCRSAIGRKLYCTVGSLESDTESVHCTRNTTHRQPMKETQIITSSASLNSPSHDSQTKFKVGRWR